MEHGTYKVSEETKDRLVNAAGELFSFHGTDTVTLREIADRARAVPNAVCYHFGDKEGLVEAVRQYALRMWDDGRIERYYQENGRTGQLSRQSAFSYQVSSFPGLSFASLKMKFSRTVNTRHSATMKMAWAPTLADALDQARALAGADAKITVVPNGISVIVRA